MPKVTIATPVFNGLPFIHETIRSIQAQTMTDFEYIIVDGGSTDGTREAVEIYAKSDPRIHLIFEKDRGMYDALMKGLRAGTAPVCGWLNADDKLMPWAFELVTETMNRGSHWVTGTPGIWDGRGRLAWVSPTPTYSRKLVARGWYHDRLLGSIQQESTFFSRELLDRVPSERIEAICTSRLCGDFLLWTEFARHSELKVLPTVISGFRLHAGNRSADAEKYLGEIKRNGFPVPQRWVRHLLAPLRLTMRRLGARRLRREWSAFVEAARTPSTGVR